MWALVGPSSDCVPKQEMSRICLWNMDIKFGINLTKSKAVNVEDGLTLAISLSSLEESLEETK